MGCCSGTVEACVTPMMLSMTLARALTYKKRVIERLTAVSQEVTSHNSTMLLEGAEPEANVAALVEERERLVNHLLDLKCLIIQANQPIQRDILRLSELKSKIIWLNGLPTLHAVKQYPYAYSESQSPTVTYQAVVRKADVEAQVRALRAEIDATQERIERHNYTTEIQIENVGL